MKNSLKNSLKNIEVTNEYKGSARIVIHRLSDGRHTVKLQGNRLHQPKGNFVGDLSFSCVGLSGRFDKDVTNRIGKKGAFVMDPDLFKIAELVVKIINLAELHPSEKLHVQVNANRFNIEQFKKIIGEMKNV